MTYGVGGAGVVPEASTFVNPVAGTRIYLKRSDTQDKKPQTASAEYGELFINYHSNSPMLCFKDNANQIVEIRPLTALELELGELTDVDTTGAVDGMVLSYNGATWVPVSPASLTVDVDLDYTPAADKGTVTNTAGDDAVIPLANGINAGLSLNNYTTAEKTKLAGVEDGANVNVNADWNAASGDAQILNKPTLFSGDYNDLNNKPTIPDKTSDLTNDGEGGGNPFATTDQLFSGDYGDLTNQPTIPDELSDLSDVDTSGAQNGQLLRYNGASWEPGSPGAVSVDLGYTPAADKGTVTNDAGSNAEIPLATGTNAGLSLNNFTTADKNKLDGISDGAISSVDLGYTPAAGQGTVTNTAGNNAVIPLANGSNAGLSLNNFSAADKSKLDGITAGAEPGTVTSVDSGNGLTGGPITGAGTLSVQADGDTITVGAAGIKVADGKFAEPGDIPDVSLYLPLDGGNMTGGVTATVRTITAGAFDLATGNLWECGGIAVPNPTNAVAGMTGVIVFSAAPTAFGSNFKFPDGITICTMHSLP